MNTRDLSDMYSQSLRAAGSRAESIHTYKTNNECNVLTLSNG